MLRQESKAPICSGRTLQELKQDDPSQAVRLRVDVTEQDCNNRLQYFFFRGKKKKKIQIQYSGDEDTGISMEHYLLLKS